MEKRKQTTTRRAAKLRSGHVARTPKQSLTTHLVGALPILNRILQRMKLREFLQCYLPPEDGRTKLPASCALLLLVKNILISRAPIYGVGEWSAGYAPELLGLVAEELNYLNDDRMGRCLEKLFETDHSSLALAVTSHVVKEFGVQLEQLHNDSTTISFYGAYDRAGQETRQRGRDVPAITWGHSKDHRPDLKQLLFILTVARDGAVPVYFTAASGNVTDDTTHRNSWDLLCQLAGRRDFLYVADCKLATTKNMNHIHRNGGRFISVLPRTRREDTVFRERLAQGDVAWQHLYDKMDEGGQLLDRLSVCPEPAISQEGYRVLWYRSTRKAELDAVARAERIDRALQKLAQFREKLCSPRTRYRDEPKVVAAVEEILTSCRVQGLIVARVKQRELESYRQDRRGRPGKETRYVKQVRTRYDLTYEVDAAQLAKQQTGDGVFPLISNVETISEREALDAYKKQPQLEKRFSQLKTDFRVAPVYLKEVRRIQALLCVYFFVLLVEALLERELRQAMSREEVESLPMYPEGRPCHRPTARRLIDLFENVQRHTLRAGKKPPTVMVTELTRLQRRILKLLRLSPNDYGR